MDGKMHEVEDRAGLSSQEADRQTAWDVTHQGVESHVRS